MKKQTYLWAILMLAFTLSISFNSCKNDDDDDPEPQPQPEIIIPETTKVLDESSLAELDLVDTSTFTFRFKKATTLLSSLNINDVLVAGISDDLPYGCIRKITMISPDGPALVVETTQATLPEAITKGSIEFENQGLKFSEVAQNNLKDGIKLLQPKSGDGLGFEIDYDEYPYKEGDDYVHSWGHLYLDAGFNFGCSWEVDLTELEIDLTYFKTSVYAEQSGSIFVESNYNYSMNERFPLGSLTFNPWVFYIGPIPVVFVPKISFDLNAKGQISAHLNTFVSDSYEGEVGIKFDGSWKEIFINEADFDYALPDLQSSANFTVKAGPKASLKLYGVAGPYVSLLGYGKLTATQNNEKYNIDLWGGILGQAGAEIEVLGISVLDKTWNIFDLDENLYHLENGNIEESVSFIQPTNGQSFAPGVPIEIRVTTSGGTPDKVDYYFDGDLLESTTTPFEYTITEPLSPGTHQLEAKAYFDESMTSSSIEISISDAQWVKIDVSNVLGNLDDINCVYFYDTETGWAGGGDDGIHGPFIIKTTDGGLSWTKQNIPDLYYDSDIMDILFVSSSTGYATAGNHLLTTYNGGTTWQEVDIYAYGVGTNEDGKILVNDFYSAWVRFALSTDWTEHYLPDMEGQTGGFWYLPGGDAASLQDVCMPSNNACFIGGMYSENKPAHYFATFDGMQSWEFLSFPETDNESTVSSFSFIDEDEGWAAGGLFGEYSGFLYHTTDGGHNWEKLSNMSMPFVYTVQFVSSTEGYIASGGLEYCIYRSNDGGESWQGVLETPTPYYAHMRDLMFVGKNFGVAVGDYGTIYRYAAK